MKFVLLFLGCILMSFQSNAHNFSNSVRETLELEDSFDVLPLIIGDGTERGNCSSFIVKNDKNENLLLTALHCFDDEVRLERLCREKRISTVYFSTDESGEVNTEIGYCSDVIVSSKMYDMVLLRIEFSANKGLNLSNTGYSLANYVPETCTSLNMLGYPTNTESRGYRLVQTKNCWVPPVEGEYFSDYMAKFVDHYVSPTEVINRLFDFEAKKTVYEEGYGVSPMTMIGRHNCTVFGGNSGGPLLIEGTKIAVGMPSTYSPLPLVGPETSYAYMYSTAGFVFRNREVLREYGVRIGEVSRPVVSSPSCHKSEEG